VSEREARGVWREREAGQVRQQINEIEQSPLFRHAPKLVALLRYIIDAELTGRAGALGQSDIAIDVMGRGADFDPSIDSVVRVEAGRLRARLREYYATEGRDAAIRIVLPKGRYAPVVEFASRAEDAGADETTQDIRFLRTDDGVSIAYSVSGTGPPLIKAANWLSHLEYDYQSPVWRHWWRDLSRSYTLVRYDERGCGLSDWDIDDFSLDAWVRDLEAVTAKVGFDRFALLGISQGAAVAILYALRHPERVSHLILYGGFAQGRLKRAASLAASEEAKMLKELVRVGWGRKDPVFRKVFASLFIPDASSEQLDSFDALQRFSTSAHNAERFIEAFNQIDVAREAEQIGVPTLVVHARDEIEIPVAQANLLAKAIPDAKLVLLDSNRHILGADEPAWQAFQDALASFVAD
jgi:pimeloyl-ACP methyl ester carboxylesterase